MYKVTTFYKETYPNTNILKIEQHLSKSLMSANLVAFAEVKYHNGETAYITDAETGEVLKIYKA